MTSTRRRFGPLTVLGLVLLIAGVGSLGYVAYQLFGTNVASEHAFKQEISQLHNQWQQPSSSTKKAGTDQTKTGQTKTDQAKTGGTKTNQADTAQAKAVPGDAIALLRIPRFGSSYEVPILEGTDLDVLARGVGHYANTAKPGQIGNFAVAGHRITHGQPFSKLEELQQGDTVVVETRSATYTYQIDTAPHDLTVNEDAGWVLDPVPGHPNVAPSKAMITLTTCQDLFHSPDRSVGLGHLVETTAK